MIRTIQKIIDRRVNRLQEAAFAMFMGYLLKLVVLITGKMILVFPSTKFQQRHYLKLELKNPKTTNPIEILWKISFLSYHMGFETNFISSRTITRTTTIAWWRYSSTSHPRRR